MLGYSLSDIKTLPAEIYVAPEIDGRTLASMVNLVTGRDIPQFDDAEDDGGGDKERLLLGRRSDDRPAVSPWTDTRVDMAGLVSSTLSKWWTNGPLSYYNPSNSYLDDEQHSEVSADIFDSSSDSRRLATSMGTLTAFRRLLQSIIRYALKCKNFTTPIRPAKLHSIAPTSTPNPYLSNT